MVHKHQRRRWRRQKRSLRTWRSKRYELQVEMRGRNGWSGWGKGMSLLFIRKPRAEENENEIENEMK